MGTNGYAAQQQQGWGPYNGGPPGGQAAAGFHYPPPGLPRPNGGQYPPSNPQQSADGFFNGQQVPQFSQPVGGQHMPYHQHQHVDTGGWQAQAQEAERRRLQAEAENEELRRRYAAQEEELCGMKERQATADAAAAERAAVAKIARPKGQAGTQYNLQVSMSLHTTRKKRLLYLTCRDTVRQAFAAEKIPVSVPFNQLPHATQGALFTYCRENNPVFNAQYDSDWPIRAMASQYSTRRRAQLRKKGILPPAANASRMRANALKRKRGAPNKSRAPPLRDDEEDDDDDEQDNNEQDNMDLGGSGSGGDAGAGAGAGLALGA